MNLMNAKWAPDGRRCFVVFTDEIWCRVNARPRTIKSLIVAEPGGEATFLGDFTHHPMWAPDGSFVLAHLERDGVQDLVAYRPGGRRPEVILPKFTGIHTSLDAAGRRALTDAFDDEAGTGSVRLVDLADGAVEVLDEGPHVRHDHTGGSHIHPQFSRDGASVYYNLAAEGQPQLYRLRL